MTKRSILLATSVLAAPRRAYALEATVDNLDNVPEALHAEYVQTGDKYVLQVNGMKPQAEFDRLQSTHNTLKNNHNVLVGKVTTAFGDRPFEEIRADLDRIPELEAGQGQIDEDKLNNMVEARTRTKLAPVERERDQAKARVGELEGTVQQLTTQQQRRKISDDVRAAAKKAGVTDEAMDDALRLGRDVFEIREDDGKVVVKEGAEFAQGIEPSVLFADLQSKKPHWFGESRGGGSSGNRDTNRNASNPFSKANWNMTAQGQLMSADPAKAEQMAKMAGHKDAATAQQADAK